MRLEGPRRFGKTSLLRAVLAVAESDGAVAIEVNLIHERTGRMCVTAFDEFQEVVRIDPALPGVFRSELETHRTAAGYVFSRSHPGLMRDLFSDRRHAFFAQAAPIPWVRCPPMRSRTSSRRGSRRAGGIPGRRSVRCWTRPKGIRSGRCCWRITSTRG